MHTADRIESQMLPSRHSLEAASTVMLCQKRAENCTLPKRRLTWPAQAVSKKLPDALPKRVHAFHFVCAAVSSVHFQVITVAAPVHPGRLLRLVVVLLGVLPALLHMTDTSLITR